MERSEDKIKSLPQAKKKVAEWKGKGQKVVFTNGCFDILHLGHIDYLEKARNLGDKLIIGLNSDDSVGRFIRGSAGTPDFKIGLLIADWSVPLVGAAAAAFVIFILSSFCLLFYLYAGISRPP